MVLIRLGSNIPKDAQSNVEISNGLMTDWPWCALVTTD